MDAESIAGLVGLAVGLLVLLSADHFRTRSYKRGAPGRRHASSLVERAPHAGLAPARHSRAASR